MKDIREVLNQKEARFLELLREIEVLRATAHLLLEDADPDPLNGSSAAVESAKPGINLSDTQHAPVNAGLDAWTDADRAVLDDPAQWNSGMFVKR